MLEWDPSSHALRTSSMHYFEGEPSMRREARAAAPLPPRVVADPAGRCAAMAMAGCHVALLPAYEVGCARQGSVGTMCESDAELNEDQDPSCVGGKAFRHYV